MNYKDRESILRRISTGDLYLTISYKYQDIDVIFHDPTLKLLTKADWVEKRFYNKNKDSREFLTLEESYSILIDRGDWSDKFEKELIQIKNDLKQLRDKLNTLKFHKAEQRAISATIKDGEQRLSHLSSIKHQFYKDTLEWQSILERRRFIVSNIAEIADSEEVSVGSLLKNQQFLDILSVYYYEEHSLSESQIRDLARNDPWRLYWTVSKDTGTNLFPHSVVEMTEYQYALVSWSKIYDFAYQSQNRPADDVISDDARFDAWYQGEAKRIESEMAVSAVERSLPGIGGSEVFIPADLEGAKEVYALNNPDAKNRVAQREKAIREKGVLKETELPDVKRDLNLEANRLASAGAISRSK